MKCLSVCQPFAELIVQGKKTIELRKWNTKFRGEFLVHAAKNILMEDCKRMKISSSVITTGAIIGKVNLVDVKKSLHDGFSEALNVQFDDASLTNIESNKAVEYRERFSSPNWINQR